MKVSIIIPVYNRFKLLKITVDSLQVQSFSQDDYEIIIVNDASDEKDFSEKLKIFDKYKKIRIYSNNKNMGLGYSLQKGLDLAKGEVVILIDADMQAEKILIEEHYNKHQQGNYLVQGIIKWPDSKKCFDTYLRPHDSIYFISKIRELLPWDTFNGNMSFKRENAVKCGGFDKKFTFGGEEIDFALRMLINDNKIVLAEKAITYHYGVIKTTDFFKRLDKYGKSLIEIYLKYPECSKYLNNSIFINCNFDQRDIKIKYRLFNLIKFFNAYKYAFKWFDEICRYKLASAQLEYIKKNNISIENIK